jgi:lantibiotic modifying enzyme
MPWQPLLQGAWKDRAWESVQAITADLSRPKHDPAGAPSLAEGAAGLAVLHAYLAESRPGHDHAALAAHYLRDAIGAVAESPAEASLYGGLSGVGWATAHLWDRLPDLDGEDDLAEIDAALLDHLDRSPWAEDYDLINGLVGFGVYALEWLPRLEAVACLERVLDRLAETAEHRPEGITWWTNTAWLPAETRAKAPQGYYNLGLAHGVPGVIALLGQVCTAGVAAGRARPLLEGAVRWLLAQQGTEGFAYWVGPGGDDRPTRLAWCYGDPGVAAALLCAAHCVCEPAWERAALAIARRAARRPPEESGVVDVGLCHGAVGLGHLFNRLFQATGEPWLAEAARFWFERSLAMRRPGRGIGGYEARQPGEDGAMTWVADPGLLTGAAGIALALLAATTPVEPAWDRALLVAIPASAGPGSNPDSAPVKVGTRAHEEGRP